MRFLTPYRLSSRICWGRVARVQVMERPCEDCEVPDVVTSTWYMLHLHVASAICICILCGHALLQVNLCTTRLRPPSSRYSGKSLDQQTGTTGNIILPLTRTAPLCTCMGSMDGVHSMGTRAQVKLCSLPLWRRLRCRSGEECTKYEASSKVDVTDDAPY